MPNKTAIVTDAAPKPAGPYSQGIIANGFIYTAGFGPQDPATGAIADDVAGQTAQVLANVAAVLAEHGATLDDVVKSTVHLEHSDRDFAAFNEEYAKHRPGVGGQREHEDRRVDRDARDTRRGEARRAVGAFGGDDGDTGRVSTEGGLVGVRDGRRGFVGHGSRRRSFAGDGRGCATTSQRMTSTKVEVNDSQVRPIPGVPCDPA
nr:Rid family hydrolase [Curtobacterium sp. B18]